jgi:hypothetical protein
MIAWVISCLCAVGMELTRVSHRLGLDVEEEEPMDVTPEKAEEAPPAAEGTSASAMEEID